MPSAEFRRWHSGRGGRSERRGGDSNRPGEDGEGQESRFDRELRERDLPLPTEVFHWRVPGGQTVRSWLRSGSTSDPTC
jgi:hypothetical protein